MGSCAVIALVVICGLVLAAAWIIRDGNENDRHKRRIMGYCFHCGYHLRGNTSGTCPECGNTAFIRRRR